MGGFGKRKDGKFYKKTSSSRTKTIGSTKSSGTRMKKQKSNTWADEKKLKKIQKLFGESSKGNFSIIDTIPIPHAFVIGTKHVAHASDNHMGMLGEETMKAIPCAGCHKDYSEHKTGLLVGCKTDIQDTNDTTKGNPELHKYLLKNKKNAENGNFEGFAFKDLRGNA